MGRSRVTSRVWSSNARIPRSVIGRLPWLMASAFLTGYKIKAYSEAVFGSTALRHAKTKSCAVTGSPLLHFASFRSQNFADVADRVQRSATPGAKLPRRS